MEGFTNFLLHFIFIAVFLILIVVSIILLKPFRMHQKRPYSTISLKLSYLAYLISFLVIAFLILFYGDVPEDADLLRNDIFLTISYIIIVLSFFIPNLEIFLRRRIKKKRQFYNIFFTIVNLFFVLGNIFVYAYFPFTFN